jgi:tetratricopeptide (TPR) repeat protein
MSKRVVLAAAKENWILLVLAFICFAVPVGKTLAASSSDSLQPTAEEVVYTASHAERLASHDVQQHRERQRQKALATIQEHEEAIDAEPQAARAPALLTAMGNLYQQKLLDYEEAAACYDRILREYPESSQRRSAYIGLATAYERSDRPMQAMQVYRKMKQEFPQDSQEYKYAEAKLDERIR